MRKNPYGRILRGEPKEQHLSIVPTSCPIYNPFVFFHLKLIH